MLSGKIGAGKDTLAKYLVDNYNFKRFAFADILKEYTAKKYKFDVNLCYSQDGKNNLVLAYNGGITKQVSVRQLLIDTGLEVRKLDKYYWSDKVIENIKKQNASNIVISDWRFPDEYYRLSKEFVTVIPIRINGITIESEYSSNISETALDSFLFADEIDNKLSKQDLYDNFEQTRLLDTYFRV